MTPWEKAQAIMQKGLCRTCQEPRGEDGTKSHCRPCADAHNLARVNKPKPKTVYVCLSCKEGRPVDAFRTVRRASGPQRHPICQRCERVARRAADEVRRRFLARTRP